MGCRLYFAAVGRYGAILRYGTSIFSPMGSALEMGAQDRGPGALQFVKRNIVLLDTLILEPEQQASVAASIHLKHAFQDSAGPLEIVPHVVGPGAVRHQEYAVGEAEEGHDQAEHLI